MLEFKLFRVSKSGFCNQYTEHEHCDVLTSSWCPPTTNEVDAITELDPHETDTWIWYKHTKDG